MANFCSKCGTRLDTTTGLCPNCDSEKLNTLVNVNENIESNTEVSSAVEEKPKKKKNKVLTTFITILLSIFLFFTLIFAILIFDVRNAVKDGNVEKLLDDIQFTDLIDSTNVITDSDMDRFYESMNRKFGIKMSDNQLNDFIKHSTVKEFVAEKMEEFCEDFFEGEAELKIEKYELVRLIKRNASEISDEFDVYLSDSQLQEIADWIIYKDEVVVIDTETIKDNIPVLYYIVTIGFSYVTMAIFILLMALNIFLMIKNSFSQAFCSIGIEFIILGYLTGVVAMLAKWLTPLWEAICADSAIGMMIGNFIAVNVVISLVLLVLGIAILVTRSIVLKQRAKKQ